MTIIVNVAIITYKAVIPKVKPDFFWFWRFGPLRWFLN